jgi:hypothetical protein
LRFSSSRFDESTAQLAMVRPELPQDDIDFGFQQAFAGRKCTHHLRQDEAPAAFPSGPLDDPAVPPEWP